MVTHVVMWTVKDNGSKARGEVSEEIRRKIESMRGQVPHFDSLEVGINKNESSAAADVVLISRHRDWETLALYRDDPIHREVAEFVTERTDFRAVVDYES